MKKKNPLFVVTDQGKTVEKADHLFDALIKKLGLSDALDLFKSLFENLIDLISKTNSFAMLSSISDLLAQFINSLEFIIKKIDPVLAFSLFMH